ncbi:response regulator [Pseudomonas sp. BCA14]|uniref:response regulator n=1 Tax=unclassified Pseudomonas TaxID=196821 RepID=UPI00106EDB30|nr:MULTISPECIES: response regulator [unclassified Pseudomonas]TFF13038.1 response regulator [Pseudomonas sp. JMN1]TFF16279.1 response regulator [Pseudomonas sp. BCA17]TFF30216.1 response regulator [Pseudomonas sp. BCA13]TFF31057.1 response regulator [Pseudomonas sp. BCA14]
MHDEWEKLLLITGSVIVVEDDPTLRLLMVEILSEIGLQTLDFGTADEALTHMLGMSVSCPLVIADHGLPGKLQGADLIALMKAKWPTTATILTSGYGLDPSIVPSSTTYLNKPWSMNDLVTAVAKALARQLDHSLQKKRDG